MTTDVSSTAAGDTVDRPPSVRGRNDQTYEHRKNLDVFASESAGAMQIDKSALAGTLEVTCLDSLPDPRWDAVATSHTESNLFHRTAWGKVVCTTYGHTPLYLEFRRDGKLVALVPIVEIASVVTGRRGVCMPFGDFCSPLVFDAKEQEPVLEALISIGRKRRWRSVELRGGKEMMREPTPAAQKYYGHKLNLAVGIERVFAGLWSRVRGAIRKAEKSGLTVEVDTTWEAMRAYYGLHAQTRRRHGLPPQPRSFFRNIYREVIQHGLGFVVLAKLGRDPIAGAVFFCCGQTGVYKFAASDDKTRKLGGGNLVLWKGITELVERGVKILDFGRTDLVNDGLRDFKLSWGTTEETIDYFRYSIERDQWVTGPNRAFTAHYEIFGRLPLMLNRIVGRILYPHLD